MKDNDFKDTSIFIGVREFMAYGKEYRLHISQGIVGVYQKFDRVFVFQGFAPHPGNKLKLKKTISKFYFDNEHLFP